MQNPLPALPCTPALGAGLALLALPLHACGAPHCFYQARYRCPVPIVPHRMREHYNAARVDYEVPSQLEHIWRQPQKPLPRASSRT